MTRKILDRSLIPYLFLIGAAPAVALGQTGDAEDSNATAKVANPYVLDQFDNAIGVWMEAQATYWRREQYADIRSLAGTKAWYSKSDLIDAQLYVQYAKVALVVNGNAKQAQDDLGHAEALVKKGEKGAAKAETAQIKQVTDSMDGIKGEIPKSPATSPAPTRKTDQDLTGVFDALRDIVEKG